MKTLLIVCKVLLLPLITLGQAQHIPSVSLKTLDDRTVNSSDIIKDGQTTVIYFFDNNSKDLADHFEYLECLAKNSCQQDKINVIAIYNAASINSSQVKPLLDGNSIGLTTYIDLNGEFQRSMGLAANSAYLILEPGRTSNYYYADAIGYNLEFSDNPDLQSVYMASPY